MLSSYYDPLAVNQAIPHESLCRRTAACRPRTALAGLLDSVSVGMDRETSERAKSQIGFLTFMVSPLYEAVGRLAPLSRQLENVRHVLDGYRLEVADGPAS